MKHVLLLSPYPDTALERGLRLAGDQVTRLDGPVTLDMVRRHGADFLLSYGCRHMIPLDVISSVRLAMNLHISLLPHNRGADPNLWSWLFDTPKGVTLHLLDAGIDTGAIIGQREVTWQDTSRETLATTYARLRDEAEQMVLTRWDVIRAMGVVPVPQPEGKPARKSADKNNVMANLPTGWDSPIDLVEEIGAEIRASVDFWADAPERARVAA